MSNYRGLPSGIWALGLVSLFMDISSEMIHALLPVFMVTSLGASMLMVGLIEGLGEGVSLIVRVFSGALSDWLQRRKPLIFIGYFLGTLSKPLFAMAQGLGLVTTARTVDRIGKGIRGAPRDALVADLSEAHVRGAAFGLRQALDSVGAFFGPLLAIVLMVVLHDDMRQVFWWAVVPGLIAVTIIIFFIHEPETRVERPSRSPLRWHELNKLGGAYWVVLAIAAIFTLTRFSEAFLILRAQGLGLSLAWVPTILMIMSLAYAMAAYPAGKLSDRLGRPLMLVIGLLLLVVADLILARATGLVAVYVGSTIWGLHMAFTQGIFSAWVADRSEAGVRGTAFGLYGLVTGVVVILASVLAGGLWEAYGAAATFYVGAGLSVATLLGFVLLYRRKLH